MARGIKAGKAKKMKKLWKIFSKILIAKISASEPSIKKNIKMVWSDGLSHHFKTIRLFLGAAVDEKTAAQKPEKVKISATPSQFF